MKNTVIRCPKCGHVFGFGSTEQALRNHMKSCKGADDKKDQYGIR
jgi:phage FluMu protein Com